MEAEVSHLSSREDIIKFYIKREMRRHFHLNFQLLVRECVIDCLKVNFCFLVTA